MTRSLGEDFSGLTRLKESRQIMKATVNLNQVLQGGLAGLVAWLFKTVNDLQQGSCCFNGADQDSKEINLMDLAIREQDLNNANHRDTVDQGCLVAS